MEYIVNCIRTKPFVRIKANFGIHKIWNRQSILYIGITISLLGFHIFNFFCTNKISMSSSKFIFLRGRSENQDGRLASDWLRQFWLLCNCLVFWADWKPRWQSWSLIDIDNFNFVEQNLMQLDRGTQRHLPSLCFADRSVIYDDLPGLFLNVWLFLYNLWMEFDWKQVLLVLFLVCLFVFFSGPEFNNGGLLL